MFFKLMVCASLHKKADQWSAFLFGAPQCIVVEPQEQLESQSNLLEYNENPLVVTKIYSVKWQKDEVDLVELAKNRWINQISQREIAEKMRITRGQVNWNLRKFKKAISELSDSAELAEILKKIKEEKSK